MAATTEHWVAGTQHEITATSASTSASSELGTSPPKAEVLGCSCQHKWKLHVLSASSCYPFLNHISSGDVSVRIQITSQILAAKESGNLDSDFNIGEVGFIASKYSQIWEKAAQKSMDSYEYNRCPLWCD